MTKRIPLTKGKDAIVDAFDFYHVGLEKWHAIEQTRRDGSKRFYAARKILRNGKQVQVLMHRVILGITNSDVEVDHIDGNTLNNSRSNLRLATRSENSRNARAIVERRGEKVSSKFRGVTLSHSFKKPWKAQIYFDKRKHSLGYFYTEEDAAKAYDEAAQERFGEFARTNF